MRTASAPYDVAIPLIGFNPSGGMRMVIRVANALVARGARVVVVVPRGASTPPIALHPAVDLAVRGSARGLRDRLAFVARLPRARVYVATGYQTPLLIACGRLLHGGGGRMVSLLQADERTTHIEYGSQPAWLKPLLRLVASAGLRIPATRIAVSRAVANAVGPARIHRVIPPGIDGAYIARAQSDAPGRGGRGDRVVVGVLAQPGAVKGLTVALEAFARLRDRTEIRFVAFDEMDAVSLPAFVEPFSRIGAHHPLDITEFYDRCDVFVFPSRVEGFGLPPLEAMACGAAVVMSDCGGVREYAHDGRNCLVVAPGDAEAMATALRRLAGDAALRATLSRAGRETATRFPADRFATECADEIERLYRAP